MSTPQSVDEKLDTQTSLLKYILGGVGTALLGLAVSVGSFINGLVSRGQANEDYLRDKVVETLEKQTTILKEIRDDQKKFPAVAERRP